MNIWILLAWAWMVAGQGQRQATNEGINLFYHCRNGAAAISHNMANSFFSMS
jgi:hypothetical protein